MMATPKATYASQKEFVPPNLRTRAHREHHPKSGWTFRLISRHTHHKESNCCSIVACVARFSKAAFGFDLEGVFF